MPDPTYKIDPDKVLNELRTLVANLVSDQRNGIATTTIENEFTEMFQALDEWISQGGNLPRNWQQ